MKINRRQFLQLGSATAAVFLMCRAWAISAFIAPDSRPEPEANEPLKAGVPPGNQWVFPLAFPAWFPVEPAVPHTSRIYLPTVRNG